MIHVGTKREYDRGELEARVRGQDWAEKRQRLFEERCANDIFFALFEDPERVVDKLLEVAVAMAKKKSAPDLSASRGVDELMLKFQNPHADPRCKAFFLLGLAIVYPEIRECLNQGRIGQTQSMQTFWAEMEELFGQAFHSNFSAVSIVPIVHNVMAWASVVYRRIQHN
jgi:hypothetical protein